MDDIPSLGQGVPDCIILSIFKHLSAIDLCNAGLVCKSWHRVSNDEFLWKRFVCADWNIPLKSATLPNENSCWKDEYVRLVYHTPICEAQKLTSHTDQVLHVSFSHDGLLFSSCSKDCHVKVWNSTHPVSLRYDADMSLLRWGDTQFSQFNDTDTLLLVSGVLSRSPAFGEIGVFSLKDKFDLQWRILNKPGDFFGAWYSDIYFISATFGCLAESVARSGLWINSAFPEIMGSKDIPVIKQLYKFYNKNASSICCVMFANCTDSLQTSTNSNCINGKIENDVGCSESYFSRDSSDEESSSDEDDDYVLADREKYLIFITGSKAFTPHEIGFKRMKPVRIKRKIILDLNKRFAKGELNELENNNGGQSPNWLDESQVEKMFDKIDHRIDLEGHIIGMALSPDHKFLYVNCRAWPEHAVIEDPYEPPPIAEEIDIHVIDMTTLKEVGTILRSHKAYTPNDECCFIFLDVSDNYVASGAEDKFGYLWDRHYNVLISKLSHSDVVNSVAFNPRDEEMLISTSDDFSIKVWRSKSLLKTISAAENN